MGREERMGGGEGAVGGGGTGPSAPGREGLVDRVVHKVTLFLLGVVHMLLSSDRRWSKSGAVDPDVLVTEKVEDLSRVTLVFIRHGESAWNDIFNKGFGPGFVLRLARGLVMEVVHFATLGSVFLDSELNAEGVEQAAALRGFIQGAAKTAAAAGPPAAGASAEARTKNEVVRAMAGSGEASVVVSSNLRRAIATVAVCLWDRLALGRERVLLMSELQEISRNVDTLSVSPAGRVPELPDVEAYVRAHPAAGGAPPVAAVLDGKLNRGNKSYRGHGIDRLRGFASWAVARQEKVVIVAGHSLWFKYFFQTFLPHGSAHVGKTSKIANGGVVALTLTCGVDKEGRTVYRVPPESVTPIHLGFEKPKDAKKKKRSGWIVPAVAAISSGLAGAVVFTRLWRGNALSGAAE